MRAIKITKQFTGRDSKSLNTFLAEVNKIPLLCTKEEVLLVEKIKNGDKIALERLVNANLKFVVSIAKQYQSPYQDLALGDLINEGAIGLIKAAKRFDETMGFKFISYAVWWIRESILTALNDYNGIRIPINKKNDINKIKILFNKLEQEYGREPTNEEISNISDFKIIDIEEAFMISQRVTSLDATQKAEDEQINMYDFIKNDDEEPDQELNKDSLSKEVNIILKKLKDREKDIIEDLYGFNNKNASAIEDVAKKFCITRERVRQIKEKTLTKIRLDPNKNCLRQFLG